VPAVAKSPALAEADAEGECLDLSKGGAGLRLEISVAVGAPVRLTLRLRQVPPLVLTGRIAWAHLQELPDYYSRLKEMEGE